MIDLRIFEATMFLTTVAVFWFGIVVLFSMLFHFLGRGCQQAFGVQRLLQLIQETPPEQFSVWMWREKGWVTIIGPSLWIEMITYRHQNANLRLVVAWECALERRNLDAGVVIAYQDDVPVSRKPDEQALLQVILRWATIVPNPYYQEFSRN